MPQTLGILGSSHDKNTLWTWGNAANGQLGNGTTTPNVTVPTQIGTFTDWEMVSQGGFNAGIRNGKLYTWGNAANGQLGNGTTTPAVTVPTQIGSDSDWKQVSRTGFVAGIRDEKLYTWGNNANHRTAQGTDVGSTNTPTQVGSDTDWKQVACGNTWGAAIKTNGTLYTWGANTNYQTAQGTNAGTTTAPTQVGSDTDWEEVWTGGESGVEFGVALKGGKIVSWGANSNGQTGQNTTSGTTNSPTVVSGFSATTDWTSLSASFGATITAIREGKLYMCGTNNLYRQGRNTNVGTQNTLAQVGSDTDWVKAVNGFYFGVGIKTDGTLWSWGGNQSGSTGQGTTTGTTNTPTQIGTDTGWKGLSMYSGGGGAFAAIKG
jgi:alpha-tubulin suppressor-like RCC1 family protein